MSADTYTCPCGHVMEWGAYAMTGVPVLADEDEALAFCPSCDRDLPDRPEKATVCPDCQGNGCLLVGTHQDRETGVWDTEEVTCGTCKGTGFVASETGVERAA